MLLGWDRGAGVSNLAPCAALAYLPRAMPPMETSTGRSLAILFFRVAVAALFLYTAYLDVQHLGGLSDTVAKAGYPAPKIMAILSLVARFAGGASLLLGALTPLGCLSLMLFLGLVTYSFHFPGARAGDPMQMVDLWKNLSIFGGLWVILAVGPGRFSLDARMLRGAGGGGARKA